MQTRSKLFWTSHFIKSWHGWTLDTTRDPLSDQLLAHHLGSVCQGLSPLLWVQQVEAHEHGRTLRGWHGALIPEAQARAHRRAQLATLHGSCQLHATLDAQLLRLVRKQGAAIGCWSRESTTHAEDVVEPEGVTEIGRPIKELLPAPSIITGQLLVETDADR